LRDKFRRFAQLVATRRFRSLVAKGNVKLIGAYRRRKVFELGEKPGD
jgi:hypothetical protein